MSGHQLTERMEETVQITNDLKYNFLDGRHWFDLKNLKLDSAKRQIEFLKVSVRADDPRQLMNKLTIENNDLLVGTEEGYRIRYIRVQN